MSSRALSSATSVEHLFGGNRVGRRDEIAVEAELGAGLHLAADVDLGRGHVAHQHRGQPRPNALGGKRLHFFGHFLLDGRGNGRAIENLRHVTLQGTSYRLGLALGSARMRDSFFGCGKDEVRGFLKPARQRAPSSQR